MHTCVEISSWNLSCLEQHFHLLYLLVGHDGHVGAALVGLLLEAVITLQF